MAVPVERAALYYPHIHIQNVNWLKAALLSFRQVRRMVPYPYHLRDTPEILEYTNLTNSDGDPLLLAHRLEHDRIEAAESRLLELLKAHSDFIQRRYSSQSALANSEILSCQSADVHLGKMVHGLRSYLEQEQLAWEPTRGPHQHEWDWRSMHPRLAESIMSLLAIDVARQDGLDVVTDSLRPHHALSELDEDAIFSCLLERTHIGDRLTGQNSRCDDLAMLVLHTHFSVDSLSAAQIAELIKEGKDHRAFKSRLLDSVSRIPRMQNGDEYRRRLANAAKEIVNDWGAHKRQLPHFALDAMASAVSAAPPALATQVGNNPSEVVLAAGFGMTIFLLSWNALGVWRRYQKAKEHPLHFLSRIEASGATLITPPV